MKSKDPYQNQFQKGSPRLFGYDYSSEGYYYITICTKDRIHYFGRIENGKMLLSKIGMIVRVEWLNTKDLRKDMHILLDEYCLMPNHFHAIIRLGDPTLPTKDPRLPVSNFKQNKFGPQVKNLSSIIRGFKGACTKNIHKNHDTSFNWQRRFYDHIIRDLSALESIRDYIKYNPLNWKEDELM